MSSQEFTRGIGLSRRQFLQFAGAAGVLATARRTQASWLVSQARPGPAGRTAPPLRTPLLDGLAFEPVPISRADAVVVPPGFGSEVILRQGDLLNSRGDRFGDQNDYLAWLPRGRDEGWLWVNHEGVTLPVVTGAWKPPLTADQCRACLSAMGGSAIRVRRHPDGRWRPLLPHPRNFRLNGLDSVLRLTGPAAGTYWVHGAREVTGSTSNCGGGVTPWGSVCSGEENFQDIWGDSEMGDAPLIPLPPELAHPPEHFGWIVEIDPDRRRFWKHTALGRFAHENIAFALSADRRLVAYMGDDRERQCLYKFVSRHRFRASAGAANRRLLTDGTLFAADTVKGRWLPLDPDRQPALRHAGFDRARVCVHTRTAARIVGATPLARPEDVEVHPVTGEVYVALTAWEPVENRHVEKYFAGMAGALARLREAGGDAGAEEFAWEILVPGTLETGLAWPDNLGWSDSGDLLVTTDFAQKAAVIANSPQALLGHNFLVIVPTSGPRTGHVLRFAVAPAGAEFCSPILSPDRGELWVSVQHPGDNSTGPDAWTSHWPDGGESIPRSGVVALSRPA